MSPDNVDFLEARDDILEATIAIRTGLRALPDHETFRREVLSLMTEARDLYGLEHFMGSGSMVFIEDRDDYKYVHNKLVVKYWHPDDPEQGSGWGNFGVMNWIQLILDAIHNSLHY